MKKMSYGSSNLTVIGDSKSRNKEARNERRENGFPAHVLIFGIAN